MARRRDAAPLTGGHPEEPGRGAGQHPAPPARAGAEQEGITAWPGGLAVTADGPLAAPAWPGAGTVRAGAGAEPVLDEGFDARTLALLRQAVLAHAVRAGMAEARPPMR